MDIERERGITIKLNTATMNYTYNNTCYQLNLIDTRGMLTFPMRLVEVLHPAMGAILVVDAAQGIEAQTLANMFLAMENDLVIIPVINKIDLPNANVPKVLEELNKIFGFTKDEVILTSAKTGEGVEGLVQAIIKRIPAPKGSSAAPLQALIFDSIF